MYIQLNAIYKDNYTTGNVNFYKKKYNILGYFFA